MINKIAVVHAGNVNSYPPVISLLENMLGMKLLVDLICGTRKSNLPTIIANSSNINVIYIPENNEHSILKKIERNSIYKKKYRDSVRKSMKDSDILWTTTDVTVKILGKTVLDYKHVMQLMELIESLPQFGSFKYWKFPIKSMAQKAWKVVVPQIDRAYIQKTWWELDRVPSVLPNKPYSLDYGEPTDKMLEMHKRVENENRRVLLYLGVIGPDRNIDKFAEAIKNSEEYVLYLIGRTAYGEQNYLEQLLKKYSNIEYLGFFNPPQHLYFVKDAYIGILPYVAKSSMHYSVLNAQYCAPNKIYEYSGFGIPMIGTDVLGIKRPLEQYKMGIALREITEDSIASAIRIIDHDYKEFSDNSKKFYSEDSLTCILNDILENN